MSQKNGRNVTILTSGFSLSLPFYLLPCILHHSLSLSLSLHHPRSLLPSLFIFPSFTRSSLSTSLFSFLPHTRVLYHSLSLFLSFSLLSLTVSITLSLCLSSFFPALTLVLYHFLSLPLSLWSLKAWNSVPLQCWFLCPHYYISSSPPAYSKHSSVYRIYNSIKIITVAETFSCDFVFLQHRHGEPAVYTPTTQT